jgi:hypothetical protein
MRDACRGFALIDTHVAGLSEPSHGCSPEVVERVWGGKSYHGRTYPEYPVTADDKVREEKLWAAWSDPVSFWPFEEDLVRMFRDAGFSCATKIAPGVRQDLPPWQVEQTNRVLYVCAN